MVRWLDRCAARPPVQHPVLFARAVAWGEGGERPLLLPWRVRQWWVLQRISAM